MMTAALTASLTVTPLGITCSATAAATVIDPCQRIDDQRSNRAVSSVSSFSRRRSSATDA